MPTKKEQLLEEATELGLDVTVRNTIAELEEMIAEAKAAEPPKEEEEAAAPASPPMPDMWPAGTYRTVCNIIASCGDKSPGVVVELSADEAASLGAQGAIERI